MFGDSSRDAARDQNEETQSHITHPLGCAGELSGALREAYTSWEPIVGFVEMYLGTNRLSLKEMYLGTNRLSLKCTPKILHCFCGM